MIFAPMNDARSSLFIVWRSLKKIVKDIFSCAGYSAFFYLVSFAGYPVGRIPEVMYSIIGKGVVDFCF